LCGLTGFGLSNFLGTVTLSKSARVEAIPPGSVLAVLKHGSVTPEQVNQLIAQFTEGPDLGLLGEPRVNVLLLNLALDQHFTLKNDVKQ